MQVVVILEVADIEWNSRTDCILYLRHLQVARKWSPELTKDQEHVSVKNSKISGGNILLDFSVFFWVPCITSGRPLPLRNVPIQRPTFLAAPTFAVDDASPRLSFPVIAWEEEVLSSFSTDKRSFRGDLTCSSTSPGEQDVLPARVINTFAPSPSIGPGDCSASGKSQLTRGPLKGSR